MPNLGRFVWVKNRSNPIFICANCDTKPAFTRRWASARRPSPLEIRAQKTLIKYGLPFEPQKRIGPWRFDFAVPSLGLLIETDGHSYHRHRCGRDIAKAKEATRIGWAVTHLTSEDLEGRLVAALDYRVEQLDPQRRPKPAGLS